MSDKRDMHKAKSRRNHHRSNRTGEHPQHPQHPIATMAVPPHLDTGTETEDAGADRRRGKKNKSHR
jgi:hypothetical protein